MFIHIQIEPGRVVLRLNVASCNCKESQGEEKTRRERKTNKNERNVARTRRISHCRWSNYVALRDNPEESRQLRNNCVYFRVRNVTYSLNPDSKLETCRQDINVTKLHRDNRIISLEKNNCNIN